MKRAIEVARNYLGMHELRDNAKLIDFLNKCGCPVNPSITEWCGAFVNACLVEAGYPSTKSFMARSFLSYGNQCMCPDIGDIIVLKNGNSDVLGHVGFFIAHIIRNGVPHVLLIGGNQDNQVCAKAYPSADVLDVRTEIWYTNTI